MKYIKPKVVFALFIFFMALNAQAEETISFHDASKIMAEFKQWMIGANATGNVIPWRKNDHRSSYNIKGAKIKKFFHYEKQGSGQGINLGWTKDASAKTAKKNAQWHFKRNDRSNSPILYGESVAISWGKGKKPYIKYGKRAVGINLHWSKEPVYEWTILGGQPGTPVGRGKDWVVIYNIKNQQPLIYFKRTAGAHIGWNNSTSWYQGANKLRKRTNKDAVIKALRKAKRNTPYFRDVEFGAPKS